jgi:hypothetical protein
MPTDRKLKYGFEGSAPAEHGQRTPYASRMADNTNE